MGQKADKYEEMTEVSEYNGFVREQIKPDCEKEKRNKRKQGKMGWRIVCGVFLTKFNNINQERAVHISMM